MKRPFPLTPLTLPCEEPAEEVETCLVRRNGRLRIVLEDGLVSLRHFCRRMRFYREEWKGAMPELRKNERVIIVL